MSINEKPKIEVRHTSILIHRYDLDDSPELQKQLSVYDPITHSMDNKGFMYDENERILYIPRGIDINYLEKIFHTEAIMNYEHDPIEKIVVHTKIPPRDDVQRNGIAFLIGAEKFQYTKKYSQLLLQMPTGSGKTFVMISSLQFIGERAFIIVPNERLKKQAIESLLKFTDINKEFIIDVSGKSKIESIMKKPPKGKVYVACHSTLISYAKNNGWKSIEELFKQTKVGVKIYDEAHLYFENILKIDFHSNTKKTIYVSATFERSDYKENLLFTKCFKNVVTFRPDNKIDTDNDNKKDTFRKHIMYLGIQYNSHPSVADQSLMVTKMGFNKIRYANYQVEQDEFYDTLDYVLKYFKTYEGKKMILCSTIDGVEKIKKFIDETYNDIGVSSYHSKISDEDREKAFTADIICTTPQSAGVGVDIPGLRVVIMCEAYASKVQAEQVSGRLREYSKDKDTFYVELIDVGFQRVYKMWKGRLSVFKKKCKKMLSLDLIVKK